MIFYNNSIYFIIFVPILQFKFLNYFKQKSIKKWLELRKILLQVEKVLLKGKNLMSHGIFTFTRFSNKYTRT